MSEKIVELSDEDFQSFVEDNERVLVDFWATWCGPCMAVKPTFEDLAEQYGDVNFAKVNIEENNMIANRYGIQAIPAFLFFEDGQVVGQAQGALSKAQFAKKIEDSFNL